MNFKLWLEADYDQWRQHIASLNRSRSPFASWFPESERVYVPLQISDTDDESKKEIEDFLNDIGYEIFDWKNGVAKEKNTNRQMRIGKLIARKYQEDFKELLSDFQSGNLSQLNYNSREKYNKKYYDELSDVFQNSPSRSNKKESNYTIVFTNDKDDIAQMSTDKNWQSCMELGKGSHYTSVFCEVRTGGFVAYLIGSHDVEMRKPIARIHIRRFDNKKGQSVAIPEGTVYGIEIPGFKQAVEDWLKHKQGDIKSGKYKRRGGSYSDTFGGERKTIIAPDNAQELGKWLKTYQNRKEETKRPYITAALEKITNSDKKYDDKLVKLALDVAKMYAPWSPYISILIDKYPDIATEEDLKNLPLYKQQKISENNPKFKEYLNNKARTELMNNLNIDNLPADEQKGYKFGYDHMAKIDDVIKQISSLTELTEPIVEKIIKFGNDLIDKYGDDIAKAKNRKSPIPNREAIAPVFSTIHHIIHQLAMKNADSPIVIEFIKRLLPYYKEQPQLQYQILYPISKLGRNGEVFLPYLKQRLSEEETAAANDTSDFNIKRRIEQLMHTIDSVETGKLSRKYTFHY